MIAVVMICFLVRFLPIPKNAATPKAEVHHGANGSFDPGACSAALDDAVIVTVAVPSGFTVPGVTAHVTPLSAEEQDRFTVPLNPFCFLKMTGMVADPPRETDSVELKNATSKSATGAASASQFVTTLYASNEPSPVA